MLGTLIMLICTELAIMVALSLFSNKKKKEGKKWLSKFMYYIILIVVFICTTFLAVVAACMVSNEYSDIALATGAGLVIGIMSATAKKLKKHRKDYDPTNAEE